MCALSQDIKIVHEARIIKPESILHHVVEK
jgi:hypothetical protein